MDIILALLGLGRNEFRYRMNQARTIHARLSGIFILIIGLIILEFILNISGVMAANLVILLICTIILIIATTRPEIIATFLGIYGTAGFVGGAINLNSNVVQGTARGAQIGWDRYKHAVVELLIWLTAVSLILGTLPIQGRLWATIVILCAIIVIYLVTVQMHKPKIFYKIAKGYSYVILIIGVSVFVRPATYIKIFGKDPISFVRVSDVETKISKIEKDEEKKAEEKIIRQLTYIEERINREEKLLPHEMKFWKEQKKKRDENTIPAKVSKIASSYELVWATSQKNKNPPPKAENWNVINEFKVSSKLYDPVNFNWQSVGRPGQGEVQTEAAGSYKQWVYTPDGSSGNFVVIDPDGKVLPGSEISEEVMNRISSRLSNDLPVPGKPYGSLVAKINNSKPFFVGKKGKMKISSNEEEVFCAFNVPEKTSDILTPKQNFDQNEGELSLITKQRVQ
jgi:hypothetical protein